MIIRTDIDALLEQECIQPGTMGFWRVYGARPTDFKVGDIIRDSQGFYQIREIKAETLTKCVFETVTEGPVFVGKMALVNCYRWGTNHILADSI